MVNINEYRQFRLALLELIGVVVAVAITTPIAHLKDESDRDSIDYGPAFCSFLFLSNVVSIWE